MLALSPAAITILTDTGDPEEIRSTLDPESKITMGNLSPVRLSPNPFFGINLDQMGLDSDTISMEWTNYNPSAFVTQSTSPAHSSVGYSAGVHHLGQPQQHHQQHQQQHQPVVCQQSTADTSIGMQQQQQHHHNHTHQSHLLSDLGSNVCDVTFINVDQLNMEQLKTEFILSDDHPCQNIVTRQQQQQLQFQQMPPAAAAHHLDSQLLEHRLTDGTGHEGDALDGPDDEYQSICSLDNSQHQMNVQQQQSSNVAAGFQYNHCSSMLDFNHFGWITDRPITPPSMLTDGGSSSVSDRNNGEFVGSRRDGGGDRSNGPTVLDNF